MRLTGTHHFDIVNLREAPDEDVDGDKGGGVRVVDARGSDPGVVHLGVHQRVQDPLLHLPGKDQKCAIFTEYQGLMHRRELIYVLLFP